MFKKLANLITNLLLSYGIYHVLNKVVRKNLLSETERSRVYYRIVRYLLSVYTLCSVVWIGATGGSVGSLLEYVHSLSLSYALFTIGWTQSKECFLTLFLVFLHCNNTYEQPHLLVLLAVSSVVETCSCIPGIISLYRGTPFDEHVFVKVSYGVQTLLLCYFIFTRQLDWSCSFYCLLLPYLVVHSMKYKNI